MTAAWLRTGAALLVFMLGLEWLRLVWLRRSRHQLETYRLRFARGTTADDVTRFIDGLVALRSPWLRHWLYVPTVIFEVHARHGLSTHYLTVPTGVRDAVLSHLRATLPSVRVELVSEQMPVVVVRGASFRLSTTERPLRTDQLDTVAASLLSSVQPLEPDEAIVVQWLVQPSGVPKPVRLAPKATKQPATVSMPKFEDYELLAHGEALRAGRGKQAEPLFRCVGRVAVRAATSSRQAALLTRVARTYQLLSAPGVELRERPHDGSPAIGRRVAGRVVPLNPSGNLRLNAAEVVGVIGWPVGITALPFLELGGCRQLPPATTVPTTGCVVGEATYPGSQRLVAISPADRLLHVMAVGPTGVGKSTLLSSLIAQDMKDGRGVVVVDPKGDLVRDCLDRVPEGRVRDVVVLDPSDERRPVGLNLLSTAPGGQELVADHVVHVFHELFTRFWGPRTEDVFRAALLTLMREPNMTLLEVPQLLTDKAFRKPFVERVRDDVVGLGPFWTSYEALRPTDQAQVISPLMNKLRQTVTRSNIRFCVGQATPRFQLSDALEQGALIFVPLQAGVLGEDTAALMGSLFISRLWQTIQGRSGQPAARRRQAHLYVDEAQKFIHLPTSIGDVLAQARGLKLGVTLAFQHLGQLESAMRQDLLANCRSKVIFQTTAKDGHAFAQEFRPYLTADDLQGLGRYEVVAQLAAHQEVAPPLTARTLPAPPPDHYGEVALGWSRQRYGVDRAEVEAEIQARHQPTVATRTNAPIGRQRRETS